MGNPMTEAEKKGRAMGRKARDLLDGIRDKITEGVYGELDELISEATRLAGLSGYADGRREAFGEAAQACNAIAETQCRHNGEAEHGADLCQEAIRALADQPPPDTGWRERPPTPAEVEAHDGLWAAEWEEELREDPSQPVEICSWYPTAIATSGKRYRPVTRELYRAPWPKGEDDAKT